MPSRVRAILYGERRDELVRQLAESFKNLVVGSTHVFLACNTSHGSSMRRGLPLLIPPVIKWT